MYMRLWLVPVFHEPTSPVRPSVSFLHPQCFAVAFPPQTASSSFVGALLGRGGCCATCRVLQSGCGFETVTTCLASRWANLGYSAEAFPRGGRHDASARAQVMNQHDKEQRLHLGVRNDWRSVQMSVISTSDDYQGLGPSWCLHVYLYAFGSNMTQFLTLRPRLRSLEVRWSYEQGA